MFAKLQWYIKMRNLFKLIKKKLIIFYVLKSENYKHLES